jgi:hypothetical protein
MQHTYKLLILLLLSNLAAFGQSAPATNYMNLGGSDVRVGVGFTNASGVYPRYPLSFPNVVGDKISLWNTNPASLTAPHYGLGVQGFRLQLFTPTTSDNIVFGVGSSANFTENVRFTGDGKVGIGTDNPASPLTVKTTGTGKRSGLDHTNGSVRIGTSVFTGVLATASVGYIQTHTDHPLAFGTNNSSAQMWLSTEGLVGIGTDSPTLAGLVVDKQIGATNAIFGSNTTGVAIESNFPGVSLNGYWNNGRKAIASGFVGGMGFNPTTGRFAVYTSFSSASAANAPITTADRLVVLANGNVGIGSATPVRKLDVSGNTRIVGDGSAPSLDVIGGVKFLTGDQGAGKILTSDADGNANWQKAGYGAVSLTITQNTYDLRNNAILPLVGVEQIDDDNRYFNGTYTVGVAGYYSIQGSLNAFLVPKVNVQHALDYYVHVFVNNNPIRLSLRGGHRFVSTVPYVTSQSASVNTVIKCNVGDVVQLRLSGNSIPDDDRLIETILEGAQFTITKL